MSQETVGQGVLRLVLMAVSIFFFLGALIGLVLVVMAVVALFVADGPFSGSGAGIAGGIVVVALGSGFVAACSFAGVKIFAGAAQQRVAFAAEADEIGRQFQKGGQVLGDAGRVAVAALGKAAAEVRAKRSEQRGQAATMLSTERSDPSQGDGELTEDCGDLTATSALGSMTFNGHEVTIRKRGLRMLLLQGLVGEKTVMLSAIQAVQFRPARGIARGYLQLSMLGGVEAKGGVLKATKDENTLLFDTKDEPAFERLASAIKGALRERQSPISKAVPPALSPADELAKFAALREQGHLTEAEFERKKGQLLGF